MATPLLSPVMTPSPSSTSAVSSPGSLISEPADTTFELTSEKRRNYLLQDERNRRVWPHPLDLGDIDVLDPPVPAAIKAKVKAIDPCKGRCLVTNASADSGIKYTHCLSRCLSQNFTLMRCVEWHWGMRMYELDLEAEYNIFPVSAQLSAMYDYPQLAPSWFLVPEDHVVDLFFSRIQKFNINRKRCEDNETPMFGQTWRGNLPDQQEGTHKYRLFPMYLRMRGIALTHQETTECLSQSSDVTVDILPFNNLPWVASHLDPKYVIMEAGRKLKMMDTGDLKWNPIAFDRWFDHQPILRRLLLLYEAWSNAIPGEAYQDPGFIPLLETLPLAMNTDSPVANPNPTVPGSSGNHSGWNASSIAQWSIDASAQAFPHDALSQQDENKTMDSDDFNSRLGA